jgi:phage shock protein PspC (stress-responsive transcriptional regulator)
MTSSAPEAGNSSTVHGPAAATATSQEAGAQAAGASQEAGAAQAAGASQGFGGDPVTMHGAGVGHAPLYRPVDDRMLAGVASGLARFLGVDVMLVRIALVVLCFVAGVGVPLYLASWLLIPEQGAEQSIAAEFLHSIQGRQE